MAWVTAAGPILCTYRHMMPGTGVFLVNTTAFAQPFYLPRQGLGTNPSSPPNATTSLHGFGPAPPGLSPKMSFLAPQPKGVAPQLCQFLQAYAGQACPRLLPRVPSARHPGSFYPIGRKTWASGPGYEPTGASPFAASRHDARRRTMAA
jgi:hypothetical protein